MSPGRGLKKIRLVLVKLASALTVLMKDGNFKPARLVQTSRNAPFQEGSWFSNG